MTKATGKSRLLKLAKWLKENPQEQWDMMDTQKCAMHYMSSAFPRTKDCPQSYNVNSAAAFFGYYREACHEIVKTWPGYKPGDCLWANANTQLQQAELLEYVANSDLYR